MTTVTRWTAVTLLLLTASLCWGQLAVSPSVPSLYVGSAIVGSQTPPTIVTVSNRGRLPVTLLNAILGLQVRTVHVNGQTSCRPRLTLQPGRSCALYVYLQVERLGLQVDTLVWNATEHTADGGEKYAPLNLWLIAYGLGTP